MPSGVVSWSKFLVDLRRLQHNVTSNAKTRQKKAQKRSLHRVNEPFKPFKPFFKPFFNAVLASAVVMLRSLKIKLLELFQVRLSIYRGYHAHLP